ncbi:MAG: LemA family protein [Candidatus Pacebacteria bacterium]|nr:LemA family protein [Candidatus Paceibacterota bacterium]
MQIALIIIAALLVLVIGVYNNLIKLRVRTDEAWADIDVQLKRRYDLIPNLVETVKGYASHEKETLAAVLEARSKATAMNIDVSKVTPDQMAEFAKVESGLSGALGKLFAVAEAYPDLKANENFLELQRELVDTENKIQAARRFYNTNVRDLNIAVQSFPANMIAGMFGFSSREFFELEEGSVEKEPVEVSFDK